MRRPLPPIVRKRVACIAWVLREFGAGWAEAIECASNVVQAVNCGETIEDACAAAIAHRRSRFGLRLSDDKQCVAVVCRRWFRLMLLEGQCAANDDEGQEAA